MAVGALGEIQKKEQVKVDAWDAFGKDAEKVLLDGGSLGEALYSDTVNFTKELKNDYLAALKSGDTSAAFAAKKGLQDRSAFTQEHKEVIKELSALRNPASGELGLSKSHTGPQLKTMGDIVAGRYTIGKNDKEELTYKTESGAEITNSEFKDMYQSEHLETGKLTGELIKDVSKSSTYNETAIRDEYERTIPKTIKEYKASMHDDLGGQGGENNLPNLLKKDFKDGNLEKEIIAALGQEGLNKFDTDGTPGLSEEEKNNFINAVTDTEDPNFDLNTSRTIFVDKMVDVVRNKHTEHWAGVANAADNEIVEADRQLKLKNTLAKGLASSKSADKINEDTNKAMIEEGKVVTKTNITSGKKTMPNLDPNKSDDGTENTISYDVAYAKDLGDKIEDESFTGGFTGQQMNRYYYKDNKGGFRQYKSKSDFIKENDLNAAIKAAGSIDNLVNGKIVYNEEQEQIIANFKAAVGGLKGGDPISISTLRTDEGIDAAQNEVVEEKTDNIYLQSLRDKKQAEANKNKTTSGGVVRE
jgi:hypothetical protein